MKKALFLTTVAETHRAFLLPFARGFRSKGWTVDAMAAGITQIPECLDAYDHVYEMDWTREPRSLRRIPSLIKRIRSIVESKAYDIVHVHTPIAAYIARLALRNRRGRPKVVYTAHGFHFHPQGGLLPNTLFLALEKTAGRWTDILIVMNRYDRAAAERYHLVPKGRIIYMPGIGIDRKLFSPNRVAASDISGLRDELGLEPDSHLFLMVAEFVPRKRHIDLIDAFSEVRKSTHLALAGMGELFQPLKKYVTERGLDDRVHFLGQRNDVPVLMRSSVATILPSIQEGLPRSVMESLCLEVPVIGSDIRGIRDLLEEGRGLLVPAKSPERLRDAMEWIIDNPDKAAEIGRRGRESTPPYDLSEILRLHENLYNELH